MKIKNQMAYDYARYMTDDWPIFGASSIFEYIMENAPKTGHYESYLLDARISIIKHKLANHFQGLAIKIVDKMLLIINLIEYEKRTK